MSRAHPILWRLPALVIAVIALAAALSACGSTSAGTSTTEPTERATTTSVPEESEAPAAEQEEGESEGGESELEGIIRIQIYGKFGGTRNQFDLLSGGHCKIVKINTTPASLKADPQAILNQEKNASVQVAPLKGATAAACRKAVESAIG
jgi:hypothetical protein